MIIANITDREHYYSLHPKMKQLWDYILTHDLANSPTGRINIDGPDFVIAYPKKYKSSIFSRQ